MDGPDRPAELVLEVSNAPHRQLVGCAFALATLGNCQQEQARWLGPPSVSTSRRPCAASEAAAITEPAHSATGMSAAVAITRTDLTAPELRQAASKCRDPKAARRMLALVLEGADRGTAAETCRMDRRTLRVWVHRSDAEGIAGLVSLPGGARPQRLDAGQIAELRSWVSLASDGGNFVGPERGRPVPSAFARRTGASPHSLSRATGWR